jgi:hypothetical protein
MSLVLRDYVFVLDWFGVLDFGELDFCCGDSKSGGR